jgi:hypothetical protein
LFLAVVYSLSRIKQVSAKVFPVILISMSVAVLINLCQPQLLRVSMTSGYDFQKVKQDMLDKIPAQAPVIASSIFLPELSNREHLFGFYKIYQERNVQSDLGKKFSMPGNVHYALIDFQEKLLKKTVSDVGPQVVGQRIGNFLRNYHWKVVQSYGSIVLLER